MTNMGISYLNYLETARSNVARETETHRANIAQETETHRANVEKERETNRSNLAREQETHRSNLANEALERGKLDETIRSNLARETETNRTNLANEAIRAGTLNETIRSNKVTEAENKRANIARETETNRANQAKEAENARKNTMDALSGAKVQIGVNKLGLSGTVSAAASYATQTDQWLKEQKEAEAQAKAEARAKAESKRILGSAGQALINTTYSTDEDAIRAITSIPSDQRLNLKLTRTGTGDSKKWKIIQNPAIDPKTGKIK